LKPDYAMAYNNLGTALKEQGKLDQAADCFRRALELKPDDLMACSNLASVCKEQGQLVEAAVSYRRALELKPDYAEGYADLGSVLRDLGRVDEAVACCRQALALRPEFAEALANLGVALREQGKLDEAVACQRRALELKPDFAAALANLGIVLREQGHLDEAVDCCRRAVQLKPDAAAALTNLGVALRDQGKLDEAVACQRRALELKPDFADAHNNLGVALLSQGKLEEAVACYDRALRWKADCPDAHFNRSLSWLLAGDFQRGWLEYQWRWQTNGFRLPPFWQPLWDGRPLQGKTILLYVEQGMGDAIQFVRYARHVKQAGARVIVECQKPLVPLLAGCLGVDELFGEGDYLPFFDVHTSLLSLPGIFQTSLKTIPAEVPYLFADPGLVEHWRGASKPIGGFKIGIAWRGSPTFRNDRTRSIPLSCFESLAGLPDVRLVSLQKGAGVEELPGVAGRFAVAELGSRLRDFADTAALLVNLDLVVTCDTAVAHLAGALGVPVWVALPLVPDWRWLLDRDDSPWYPTMRLFRQKRLGDWAGVFHQIKMALSSRLLTLAGPQA
jgi:tetratricopeptide (TPR) repeat protein